MEIRKQIDLSEDIVIKLQRLADAEKRLLKPHIEYILTKYANEHTKENQISLIESIKVVSKKKRKK